MRKIAVFLALFFSLKDIYAEPLFRQVCVRRACVKAEVSDSKYSRHRGLMFRENLAPGEGMLFIFEEEGRHNFWMTNMRFPLDIIWISKEERVVYIVENASPCEDDCVHLAPDKEAMFVLEAEAGFVEKNKIKINDRARLDQSQ